MSELRVDRRGFLRVAGATGAAAMLGPNLVARGQAQSERTLVLLQLAGGNDGLSTLVPFGDDAYRAARSSTRIEADECRPVGDGIGLHPELKSLHRIFEQGELALVQGVGYEHPNRSHFKSFDIWHAADRRGRSIPEGWVGRLMHAAYGEEAHTNRIVHVGGRVPYSLHSSLHPPVSFSMPQGYRWVKNEGEVRAAEERLRNKSAGNPSLSFLRGVMEDAQASSRNVRAAVERYRPSVEYPATPFGDQMRTAAAIINGSLGTRVLSLELGGFDTHNAQRARHDTLMRTLDGALGAFLQDLRSSPAGRETVVLVFSEFGRRVAENGSKGTDHGTAGPAFVAGPNVRGGLLGEAPSLTDLDEGDLIHTTEFRSLYATLIEGCFGVDPAVVLGESFGTLPLLTPA